MSRQAELLPVLHSRKDYFDYLNGWSVETPDALRQQRTSRTVGKTYMLETVRPGEEAPGLEQIFEQLRLTLVPVEEGSLYRVVDPELRGTVGLIEVLDPRFPVLYTLLHAEQSDRWARSLVERSPWLDRLWLSARMFEELWRWVQSASDARRLTQLRFEYDAYFEAPENVSVPSERGTLWDDGGEDDEPDEESRYLERPFSKFTMADRIGVVSQQLGSLQDVYRPLHSIVQLRVPAAMRGGHDFYFNGKVTNRSDSFEDHRQTVKLVLDTYRLVTERAEQRLWFRGEERRTDGEGGLHLHGSPVFLQFSEPLTRSTFDRFIDYTFTRRSSRLRLCGHPFRLGPTKVHVYGVDQHLWQPVMMELTARHIYLVLPEGTCGNTVHRLVTNVQRLLDPAVRAWVGEEPFGALVEGALAAPAGGAPRE